MVENQDNLIERLVGVRRVAKTTKGGRNMSFAALVITGDGKGKVGIGYAKAREVPAAAQKAGQIARRAMFEVPRIQGTIPHPIQGEDAAGVVFLRPASPGTGVIAGGPVRAVLECAGYTDVLTKSLGSSNSINIVHATINALRNLEKPETVAVRRGLPLEHVAPARLLKASAGDVEASAEADAKSDVKTEAKEAPAKTAATKKPAAKSADDSATPAKKPAAKAPAKKTATAQKDDAPATDAKAKDAAKPEEKKEAK
jgi:small subunit ribosomal protein S5